MVLFVSSQALSLTVQINTTEQYVLVVLLTTIQGGSLF